LGTGLCNDCWEVETKLAAYIARGENKARAFIMVTLVNSFDLTESERTALKRIWGV
jgi:hypothetical protein